MRVRPSLLLVLALAAFATAGCQPLQFVVTIGSPDGELDRSVVIAEDHARGDVAIVDVSGMIVNAEQDGLLKRGGNPLTLLHQQLRRAERDDEVAAVLLRINSPGGGVTASEAMYREVMRFKARSGKPVVAVLMDVAASGGYYLACSADEIVAYPTTVTGSVGVILQTIGVGPALARIGVQSEALTSGPNKDAGNPLGSLDDEEREVLQAMVDDFYLRFVEVVRTRRPGLSPEDFETVTDGRVVSGARAAELGLVDATGDVYDAFVVAKQAAGLTRARLIRYHRPLQSVESPYAAPPRDGRARAGRAGGEAPREIRVDLTPAFADLPPGFYYLWRPGVR
ncbi:MAG: signal peptide peptidase SppA [Phycisphaeraceae bacterium]